MLYKIFKFLISNAIRFYYKEIRVENVKQLSHEGPLIIIANHPNTLMDAWLLSVISPNKIYYLTKGTFFSTPLKMWFLRSLGMIPVNRMVDGKTQGVENAHSFEECFKILEQSKTLVVFPEGNSVMERTLRPLKSGTARIALEFLQRNPTVKNLKILPVGLYYSRGNQYTSSVLVKIGEKESIDHYLPDYLENNAGGARKLTNDFRIKLENLLVISQSKDQELLVDDLFAILHDNDEELTIEQRASIFKELHETIHQTQEENPSKIKEIHQLVSNFQMKFNNLSIRSSLLSKGMGRGKNVRKLILSLFLFLLSFPVYFFGLVHNFIPFYTTHFLMQKLVKDVEYYAPIAILLSIVMYPLNYLGIILLFDWFVDFSAVIHIFYVFLMPTTGVFAYKYAKAAKEFLVRFRYIVLLYNDKEAMKKLLADRESLKSFIQAK
ncbi:MAG: 1-acyl-sn-glycerol-3-phosphate acyltransferase [Bacteroidota bacterium]